MKYLLGTAHALHVFLAVGSVLLANQDLSWQRCEAVRSGGTGSQPYNFLILGFSLFLLGVGATGKGYEAQHDGHSHHGTLGGSSLCLTIVRVYMYSQRIQVTGHSWDYGQ